MAGRPDTAPFHHAGGRTGVLLCHGFASTPQSMRPWAEYLAAGGLSVSLPLLPGHATTWQDMARTDWHDWYGALATAFEELAARCDAVFVTGQSLGGCLALLLAQRFPGVRGVVAVNPSMAFETRMVYLTPLLRFVVPTTPGVTGDIKRNGAYEVAYERTPLRAVAGLPRLWSTVRRGLPRVDAPVLLFRSEEDHSVGPRSTGVLRAGVRPGLLTVRGLPNSYHVAVLDNDAETIFEESLEFVRRVARQAAATEVTEPPVA
jgi:carboxylesterase